MTNRGCNLATELVKHSRVSCDTSIQPMQSSPEERINSEDVALNLAMLGTASVAWSTFEFTTLGPLD